MEEMKAFERQVEHELHEMVGPIPRFDAVEIAETAVGAPRPGLLRRPRAMSLAGLAAAVVFQEPPPRDGQAVVRLLGCGPEPEIPVHPRRNRSDRLRDVLSDHAGLPLLLLGNRGVGSLSGLLLLRRVL